MGTATATVQNSKAAARLNSWAGAKALAKRDRQIFGLWLECAQSISQIGRAYHLSPEEVELILRAGADMQIRRFEAAKFLVPTDKRPVLRSTLIALED